MGEERREYTPRDKYLAYLRMFVFGGTEIRSTEVTSSERRLRWGKETRGKRRTRHTSRYIYALRKLIAS